MKKIIYTIFILAAFLAVSCKKNNPTTADIKVSCVPLDGEQIDVSELKVQLHQTAVFDAQTAYKEMDCLGSSSTSNASFQDIQPGKYYLCAWKDIDASTTFTAGDLFGFYTAPINLMAGKDVNIQIEVYEIE
jgi:hypothetical protein